MIPVAHNSGGPKLDIVNECVGYLASDIDTYSKEIKKILDLNAEELLQMQNNARQRALKFSDDEFSKQFLQEIEHLF